MTITPSLTCGDPINFVVGDNPTALAMGDFNGDGNLDLVTANFGWKSSSVLLGDGTGSFADPISFGNVPNTDSSSNDVIVGDFNNYQLPDITTAKISDSEGLNFIPNAGYVGAASLTITTNDQGNLNDIDTIAIAVALLGTNGNDSINGTVGDDIIYGLAGNDTIFGNQGLNIIDGGDGNDLIFGGSQADTICGGNGNDRIFASEGNNTIFSGAGNDIIYSGKGNDLINGGLGNDRIWLGGGQDTVFIARGDGADTIYNFQLGQTQIGLAGGLQFSDLAISQSNNATSIRVGEELLASLLFVQATTITASSFVAV